MGQRLFFLLSLSLIVSLVACQTKKMVDPGEEVKLPPAISWEKVEPGDDTICAYGDPFSFWVHKGKSNHLLIYFQSGGSCWNGEKCQRDSPYFNATVTEKDNPIHKKGIFQLDYPGNPFRYYSIVYIPSCTGDLFWGDTVRTYTAADGSEFVVHHHGFQNAQVALSWAYEKIPAPESVFVTGCEVGSVGSRVHAPFIIESYPGAIVTQLGDSGAFLSGRPLNFDAHFDAYKNFPEKWLWLNKVGKRARLANRLPMMADYDIELANQYPMYRFAAYNTEHDVRQTLFYVTTGGDADNFLDALQAHLGSIETNTQNFYSYTATGQTYCILSNTDFYTQETAGVLVQDWVNNLANGRPENVP